MRSIGFKNFTAMAGTVLTCFILVVFSLLSIGRVYILRDFTGNMQAGAEEVAHIASAIGRDDPQGSWLLGMTVSAVSNSTGSHIFLTDEQGGVLACSDRAPMCRHIGMALPASVLQTIRDGSFASPSDLGGFFTELRYVVTQPIAAEGEGGIRGYVFVTNSAAEIQSSWSTFMMMVSVVSVVVIVFSLVFAFAYSKRMAKPLDEIAAASRKFARGDFSVRVRQVDDPEDEMGALIDSFNKMADSLEKADLCSA